MAFGEGGFGEAGFGEDLPRSGILATATEVDTARPLTAAQTVTIGQAVETSSVTPLSSLFLLRQVSETATVTALTASQTATLQRVIEANTADILEPVYPVVLSLELGKGESHLLDTPDFLMVNVGDGEQDEVVTFDLYDDTTGEWLAVDTATLNRWGAVEASVAIPEVPSGLYHLYVTGTSTDRSDALDFNVFGEPLDDEEEDDETTAPVYPTWPAGMHTWRFIDTSLTDNAGSYVFPRNPARWTNPNRPNFLAHAVTTAPDGNVLAWEGAERSWTFEFSGFIETEAEYNALKFWSELRRRFWLIDHRDQAHYVTLEQFDARARIVPNMPWAHDYTIRVVHFYRQPE